MVKHKSLSSLTSPTAREVYQAVPMPFQNRQTQSAGVPGRSSHYSAAHPEILEAAAGAKRCGLEACVPPPQGGIPCGSSFVPAILDCTAFQPSKNDPVWVQDRQPSRYEPRIAKFLFSDLALSLAGRETGAPSDGAGGHVIVSRNLYSFNLIARLRDLDKLIVMAGVMPHPLAR
jgi:hypothetical protein